MGESEVVIDPTQDFKSYPSTKPEGFHGFHESTVAPVSYEIPFGSKVLDVGCNDGTLMELLHQKRDCDVTGIDPSEVAVAKAKEKGLNAMVGDACAMPFADATFDVVTIMESLLHIHDLHAALKEIRRVLKPEGYVLGSLPHKNLQTYIWDDKRLQKRNYDEVELQDALEEHFPATYIRVLTGSQFSVGWAHSVINQLPAEMLFKAGGRGTQPWEEEREADDINRVWFAYTQLGGTVYYRMLGFAEKMDDLGLIQAAYERGAMKDIDEKSLHWQHQLAAKVYCGTHCPSGFHIGNRIIMNQLEQILRVSNVSVWQIVNNRYVLTFLRCAKDLANGAWYHATGKKTKFVTEIDDNVFDIPEGNIAAHPYHPNSEMEWVAQQQIELSDALICSTQFIYDKMHSMFPNKPVYLVPNCIDFDIWDNLKPDRVGIPAKGERQIRIGYTGCSNHRKDLELIREPLCAILKEFPNVQFLMTPQPDPEGLFKGWDGIDNMGTVAKWVPIDEYPNFVAGWDLDIGIAPLRDNNFNRAKSNLRWLEYSALGIPTVASRVYPFKNSIKNEHDGLVCNTSQQWYDALKSLIMDFGRRSSMGKRAYERVKRDFSMDDVARKYATILEDIRHDSERTADRSL